MIESINFKLNAKLINLTVNTERILLWVLRSDIGITGPKYGCGEGLCGACTVLVDGEAILACQTAVKEVRRKEIITIEGLNKDGNLNPIQKAFVKYDALQCGFCTPGMILKAYSLLSENPAPTRKEIIDGMNANLCRCGAHIRIVQAIEDVSQEMKGGMKL
jgi:aerobic-type carbon monoxide dehydrogenase small subunit (CoxS/CutS family)